MDQITIPVDELARKANEMLTDGMKFVTLTLFESDGDGSPPWVGFLLFQQMKMMQKQLKDVFANFYQSHIRLNRQKRELKHHRVISH